ncbi:Flp pilus assembly protein [gamma proteobacterium HdN1]|nr:Flp pilus assembly protein [gamma proteobacterium HdN1]
MKTTVKNKGTLLILAGAIAAGIGGWFLTQNYIKTEVTQRNKAIDQQREAIQVVVASADLNIGDVVTLKNAVVRDIPKTFVPSEAVTPANFAATLEGRQLKYKVKYGEVILPMHVSSTKIEGIVSLLEPGERAITIPVGKEDTISGFLRPGSRVDLFLTLKDGAVSRTAPFLQRVKVIATGTELNDGIPRELKDPKKLQKTFSDVTLAVTPVQATKLIHSQSVGDIAMVLRRPEDKSTEFDDYATIDNLLDSRQVAPVLPPPPIKQPAVKTNGVFELIRGGNRS